MKGILEALTALVNALAAIFGPGGTAAILVAVAGAVIWWLWWSNRRKQRELERMLSGYDALIGELEGQLHAYRAMELSTAQGIDYAQALVIVQSMFPGAALKSLKGGK